MTIFQNPHTFDSCSFTTKKPLPQYPKQSFGLEHNQIVPNCALSQEIMHSSVSSWCIRTIFVMQGHIWHIKSAGPATNFNFPAPFTLLAIGHIFIWYVVRSVQSHVYLSLVLPATCEPTALKDEHVSKAH